MKVPGRLFVPLLACSFLLLISNPPSRTAGGAVPDCHLYLGAWVGERVNIPGDWDAFEQAIGKKLSIIHRYACNPPYHSERFDVEWANSVRAHGAIPMLSWDPDFGSRGVSLAGIAAGARDDFAAAWADQLRDWGHPIFFRMMWEHNASWYAWRADSMSKAADFVLAWQQLVSVFRSRGATNVTFVWSPNVSGNSARPIMETYPGDEYVDWVALDGYPHRGGFEGFYDTFKPDYDLLTNLVDKPLMIAETSLEHWNDQVKSERITDILARQLPNNFPEVKALVWFDEKNTGGVNFSILTSRGPLSRQAFRQGVAADYYASNYFGDLNLSPIPVPEVAVQTMVYGSAAPPAIGQPAPTATATPTAPAECVLRNLLANPSFNSLQTGSSLPESWYVSPWATSKVQAGEEAFDGDGFCLVQHSDGLSYAVYQEVEAIPGKKYSLTGWVKPAELRSGAYRVEIVPMNRHGGSAGPTITQSFSSISPGDWQRIDLELTLPANASKVRVQFKSDKLKGMVYTDALELGACQASP